MTTINEKERLDLICEMTIDGKTVRQIGKKIGISSGSVVDWVYSTPERAERYARAREEAAHVMESEILEEARNCVDAAVSRVKIDALKWVAARRNQRLYGDKQQTDITSSDGSLKPVSATPEQLAAVAAKLEG